MGDQGQVHQRSRPSGRAGPAIVQLHLGAGSTGLVSISILVARAEWPINEEWFPGGVSEAWCGTSVQQRVEVDEVRFPSAERPSPLNPVFDGHRDLPVTLLFQYGSNCSENRLNSQERLRGAARPLGLFETKHPHSVEFTVWSVKNKCAAASLSPRSGRRVWGVVYEVPDNLMFRATAGGRPSMESIEGSSYHQAPIELEDPRNLLLGRSVATYVATHPRDGLSTSLEYVTHILSGLRSFGAPADYIGYVKQAICANNPGLAAGIEAL